MDRESLKIVDYLAILFILIAFSLISFFYHLNQNFSFDQTQMLLKGFNAAFNGIYLPYGNEASTLGNLPGKISSIVIGLPLEFVVSSYSIVFFQIFVRALGIIIFANALCLLFSRKIVVAGVFFFALSPWILMQNMLYNPAYVLLGSALFFNVLIRLRNDRDAHRGMISRCWLTILLVLSVGFCLQLHFSWPVLVMIAGLLWLRRDIKISYVGVIIGLGLVALSLLPYIQEISRNPSILESPDAYSQDRYIGYGLVHVYPIFKALLYWFRFGSLLVTKKAIVPEVPDDAETWVAILAYAWIGISSLIGGISVLFAAYCNVFTLSRFRLANNGGKSSFIRSVTLCSIAAVLLAAALNTLTLNFWQIAIVIPFAILPILAFLSNRPIHLKKCVWITLVFYILANGLGSIYSEKFNINQNFHANMYRTCLLGFTPEQCTPFIGSLNLSQAEEIRKATPLSQAVIDRVLLGIIPKPVQENELSLNKEDTENKKLENETTTSSNTKDAEQNINKLESSEKLENQNDLSVAPANEPLIIQNNNETSGEIIIDQGNGASGEIILH